jgi:hypothetical protein
MKIHIMKKSCSTVLIVSALVAALVGTAVPVSAATPSAPAKPPGKKEVYELPETGVSRPRPVEGWINAEAVGTRLVIKFYDKEKKPVVPDVERGFVRLKYAAKNPVQAVLSRDGLTLATPAIVRPPHNYLVILSLFAPGATEPSESYTFKYP